MLAFEGQFDLPAQFQHIGEQWLQAIVDGAEERLEEFCRLDAACQVLTPHRYTEYDNPHDLVARFKQWFGQCYDFRIEQSRVQQVGERLGIFYRFRLQEEGVWYVVEQQVYCNLQEGRITRLQLLCSGFQPLAPGPDALLEILTGSSKSEATCAVLTPAIKTRLTELQSGQVLEVRVDDPSARGDIEAWCRLSGNNLLSMSESEGPELRFLIRKK